MTLAQIAEKPMTVATEEAISSLADSRGLSAPFLRRPNRMRLLPILVHATETLRPA
jgi:hypothetical protein